MLKTHNLLMPFVFVTRYLNQPHATAQIPRHTGLLPGQFHRPIGTIDRPVSCAGNKTYHNCRAVSAHNRSGSNNITSSIQSLFGGAANALIIDIYQQINTDLSISNLDLFSRTTRNNLSTVIFDSLNLLAGHYLDNSLSLINVIATANVPPQGKSLRGKS